MPMVMIVVVLIDGDHGLTPTDPSLYQLPDLQVEVVEIQHCQFVLEHVYAQPRVQQRAEDHVPAGPGATIKKGYSHGSLLFRRQLCRLSPDEHQ
jgi:hypothetical protein